MKKNIISIVLSVFVFVSAISISNVASALSLSDITMLQAAGIISNAQAATLMAAIAPVGSTLPIVTDNENTSATNLSTCIDLKNSLYYGSKDANTNGEVTILQDFLQSNGYLSVNPTGFYGLMTVSSVKKFQAANGISQAGFVGVGTKAKIKELSCGSTPIISAPAPTSNSVVLVTPVITGISPNSGKSGDTITLYGTGFDNTSEVSYFKNGSYMGGTSVGSNVTVMPSGVSISFKVLSLPNGVYQIKVRNIATGSQATESNIMNLTINNTVTIIATSTTPTFFTATSCSTQGTVLTGGTIGCDIVANGTIDLSKSYCAAISSGKTATLQSDVFGRTNRYFATLSGLNADDQVNVYIKGATNSIQCTPSLNLSTQASLSSIISVTPQTGGSNTLVTIFGKNLSNASSVNFYYSSGTFLASFIPTFSDINNVQFNVNNVFALNTPPGTYNVKVVTPNGTTNSLQFTLTGNTIPATTTQIVAPLITINGTPTLNLAYNSTNKESSLTATYNITFKAGSGTVNLSKNFSSNLYNNTLNQTGYNNSITTNMTVPTGTQVLNDMYGRPYIVVPANSQINLTLTLSSNPQQMFAGSYTANLAWLLSLDTGSGIMSQLYAPSTQTNSQVIVGEFSPYISSVTAVASSSGIIIMINGSRLQNSTPSNWPSNYTNLVQSATQISFITQIADGKYPIIVSDPTTGMSNNNMGVQVTNQAPTILPSLTIGKNASFSDTNIQTKTSTVKIGSYIIRAGSSEGVKITNLTINTSGSFSTLSNMYIIVDGSQINAPIQPTATNNITVDLTLNANVNKVVDIFADIFSNPGTLTTSLSASGVGITSNKNTSASTQTGQTITIIGTPIVSQYSATSCTTQGTNLYNGQIGCDIITNGTIDISKSYCISNSGKQAMLKADEMGRANRYYSTLTGLNAGDPVYVYINGVTNLIQCTPNLNLSLINKSSNVATALESLSSSDLISIIKLLTGQK